MTLSLVDQRASADPLDGAAELMLSGTALTALPSGALWWQAERLLAVGDLHLGKAERLARRGGPLLPPYETGATLERLSAVVAALGPAQVLCVGDSFDDVEAARGLPSGDRAALARLMGTVASWTWIAGNHDARPAGMAGAWAPEVEAGPLVFRHIAARAAPEPGRAEVSAHYHPKAELRLRGRRVCRRCFLADARRLILPAFGTYTGGLDIGSEAFSRLMAPDAAAYLIGRRVSCLPRVALL